MSSPTEWSNLPPELQEMVVERCDYLTRTSLRSTTFSLNLLSNSAKLFIPSIRIKERSYGIHVDYTFRIWKDISLKYEKDPFADKTRIRRTGKEDDVVEGAEPADVALELLRNVAVRKNVTIGYFLIETIENSDFNLAPKTRKMLEDAGIPLKIHYLHWNRLGGSQELLDSILENCQPAHIKELKIYGPAKEQPLDLFQKHRVILGKLERFEVLGSELLATDSDVLGLGKIKQMHLKSKEFTGKMVEKILEKFVEEGVKESFFMIKNTEESQLVMENIPRDFEKIDSISRTVNTFSKLITDGQKRVILKTGPFGVFAEIHSSESSGTCAEFREKCLKRSDCCCQETRFWPGDDGSDYGDYEDSVEMDDSFDYGYDHFEGNGGWSEDDFGEESDSGDGYEDMDGNHYNY